MENEFIPYEQALDLKELGFTEPCIAYYNGYKELDHLMPERVIIGRDYNGETITSAPLYQQAFRWFREKHNLRGFIGFRPNVKQFDCHIYDMSLSGKEYVQQRTTEEYNKDPKVGTYEEAELECLKKLIEIVKNKQ
jgi:hypothetical protein